MLPLYSILPSLSLPSLPLLLSLFFSPFSHPSSLSLSSLSLSRFLFLLPISLLALLALRGQLLLKQRRELDAMPIAWNPLIFFVTSANVVHLDLVLIEVDV